MNKTKIIISAIVAILILALIAASICAMIFVNVYEPLIVTMVAIFIIQLLFAFRIVSSRRSFYAKASWLLVLMVFPVIGLIVFILFGVNPLKRRRWDKYFVEQKSFIQHEDFSYSKEFMKTAGDDVKWLFSYSLNNMKKPIYKDNHIEVIEDNTRLFEESIKLIRSAKRYINVQSYIFSYSGFWSKIFFTELIKKANDGVKVRVIYDWLGAHRRVNKKIFDELQKYGVEVSCFNPKGISMFKGATNYRLHSKFVIVDNKTALYGGSNFADEYLSMNLDNCHWKDLNFLITGPIVNSMNTTFFNYWLRFCKTKNLWASRQNLRNDTDFILKKQQFAPSDTIAQLSIYEPDFNEFELENSLLHAFYNAKKSIKILTPYFVPPHKVVEALLSCVKRGIKVELIAHNKNQKYVQLMNRENYKKLVDANADVYEYDGYLHAKAIIIDDKYVLTGSCNIDYRSIYLDFESELAVYDQNFTNEMLKVFENIKKNATLQTSKMLADKLGVWNLFILKLLNLGKSLF